MKRIIYVLVFVKTRSSGFRKRLNLNQVELINLLLILSGRHIAVELLAATSAWRWLKEATRLFCGGKDMDCFVGRAALQNHNFEHNLANPSTGRRRGVRQREGRKGIAGGGGDSILPRNL